MVQIQPDLPDDVDQALSMHKVRYKFETKAEALVDVLKRFFAEEDYDYFLKANEEIKKADIPEYLNHLDKGVRKTPKFKKKGAR